jgi:hypothetical protein
MSAAATQRVSTSWLSASGRIFWTAREPLCCVDSTLIAPAISRTMKGARVTLKAVHTLHEPLMVVAVVATWPWSSSTSAAAILLGSE